MTVLERVRDFIIRQAPSKMCDDCITEQLNVSRRQHVNHKTNELAKLPNFDRHKDICTLCGNNKLVIKFNQ